MEEIELRDCILIVNDMENTRVQLRKCLEDTYTVLEAEDGLTAYQQIRERKDTLAAIILDIKLPVMDGFQLMEQLQKDALQERIPVLLIVEDAFCDNEIKGLGLGACDILTKPFDSVIVKKRVENAVGLYRYRVHMEEIVRRQTEKITETNNQIVDALSTVIEYRDMESGLHIQRIRIYTETFLHIVARRCPHYNLTQQTIATIASASAMHDIGKIAIPDKVLLKPAKLTPEEYEAMKAHTTKGCDILQAFYHLEDKEYLKYCYEICRHHHERWDGQGYPDGLSGSQIPLCAQVVAIADVYDALTSGRVYKPPYSHEKACGMIEDGECGEFSKEMQECFKEAAPRFQEIGARYADKTAVSGQEAFPELDGMTQDEVLARLQEASTALQKEILQRDALINAIPGGVAKVALDGELTIMFASNGFYRMTGYDRMEFHGGKIEGKCLRLFPQEDIPLFGAAMRDQLRDGRRIGLELRLVRQDGSIVWADLHGAVVEQENNVDVIQAVFIDTTVAKETEKKLLDLMNSVPGGIALVQVQDGIQVLYASDGFFHITGYSRAEFMNDHPGNDVTRLIHPEDVEDMREQIRRIVASGVRQAALEYRVVCRNGSVRWHQVIGVRAEDLPGQAAFRCVFTDVTESKAVQERLKMNEERFRVIVEQAQDVIFEWDMLNDTLYFSPAFQRKYGYEIPNRGYRRAILESDYVIEQDKQSLHEHFLKIKNGAAQDEFELRIKSAQSGYIWCKIKITVLSDSGGRAVRAIGVISDVDSYKRENALLEARSQRDLLTDLYNKVTFRAFTDGFLKNAGKNGKHAFFILDIDDFKAVNDWLGHALGDALLCEITKNLREKFRGDDLIGRSDGDEFVILLKNTPSRHIIEKKVDLIRTMFRSISAGEHGGRQIEVSGSIGISVYPQDGADFETLFQNADQALYQSKRGGKSRYTFYTK